MRCAWTLISIILFTAFCGGQTNQMLNTFAEEAMHDKDWHSAYQYYQRLFARDSSNIRVKYAYAEAARLDLDINTALRQYRQVVAYDNGRRFPLSVYWIGELLKIKKQYKDASGWFRKFYKLKLRKKKYQPYKTKAKIQIEACENALIMLQEPASLTLKKVEQPVNTPSSEYAAVERDSTVYFSSLRTIVSKEPGPPQTFYSKIYRSEIRKNRLQKVRPLDTLVNANNLHTANTAFTSDGQLMIYSRCTALNSADFQCELYSSRLQNKKWQAGARLPEPVNTASASVSMPCVGVINGKSVLFFSSNRPGGQGGMDIWYSVMNSEGSFEAPVNAGPSVNTAGNEISPWYISGDSTLYFSSDHEKGLGGFDIYTSIYLSGQFLGSQNAGFPLNSGFNDLYYSRNNFGTKAYFTTNRPAGASDKAVSCCSDIYSYDIDTTRPKVIDTLPAPKPDTILVVKKKLKLLVPLTLYFHNDEPDPRTTATVTTKSYADAYKSYTSLTPEYVKLYSKDRKGDDRQLAVNRVESFFADSVEVGMENLEKFTGLLKSVLAAGETVTITMKGYCSPLASTDYNINLAKRRISSLRNYFTTVNDGMFAKYLVAADNKPPQMVFIDVDIGELPASRASDNLKDKINSVYSPSAASERKIQVIAVGFGE
jgi:hypothetical protein